MNMKQYSADKHLMKKDFRAALQNYLEIIQDDPNNGIAHQGVAQCYFALKDHINAASASKKAIELDRSLAIPYTILAKIHIRQQDLDKAFAEASRAYELSPDLEEVANLYGALLLSNGRLEESILVLRQVLELHPESVMTHRNLAVTYREKRDFKKNVDEMRLVFRYEPTLSSVYWLLVAYQQRYFFWITLMVILSLAGALLIKSRLFLVIPAIMALQGLFWDLEFIKHGRWRRKDGWKTLLFSFVTDCALAVGVYVIYIMVSPK